MMWLTDIRFNQNQTTFSMENIADPTAEQAYGIVEKIQEVFDLNIEYFLRVNPSTIKDILLNAQEKAIKYYLSQSTSGWSFFNFFKSNKRSVTLLHIAAKNGFASVVETLLNQDRSIVNAPDVHGDTPLLRAAISPNNEYVAQRLIQAGAKLDVQNKAGETALHRACYHYSGSLAKLLIDAGANLNSQKYNGHTPLFITLQSNHGLGMAILLILNGADLEISNQHNYTILHEAVGTNSSRFVDLFITSGADIEAQNIHGRTALGLACLMRRTEIAKSLIALGANKEATDNEGESILAVAVQDGNEDIAALLMQNEFSSSR